MESGIGGTDWRNEPWVLIKAAARARGKATPDLKGQSVEAQAELREATIIFLERWVAEWREGRPVPEMLSDVELAAEAKELKVEVQGVPTDAKARRGLQKKVLEMHVKLRAAWILVQEDDGDLYEECEDADEDVMFSHPMGLPVAPHSSRCLTVIPNKLVSQADHPDAEAEILKAYGLIVARYTQQADDGGEGTAQRRRMWRKRLKTHF